MAECEEDDAVGESIASPFMGLFIPPTDASKPPSRERVALLRGVDGALSEPLERAYEMLLCLLAPAERPRMLRRPTLVLRLPTRDRLAVGEKDASASSRSTPALALGSSSDKLERRDVRTRGEGDACAPMASASDCMTIPAVMGDKPLLPP